MIRPQSFDVVVAGGGLAGATVAAALGEFGYKVLIVEPGLDNKKRLAGELIHPPGTTDLEDLGLLEALRSIGGSTALGFAVFPHDADQAKVSKHGSGAGAPTDQVIDGRTGAFVLPYAEVAGMKNEGFAMEHADMAHALLGAVERMPHVTIWRGARVTAVDVANPFFARVTVNHGKRQLELRPQLLIGADGRASGLRKLVGIGEKKTRISNMIGYVVKDGRLPHPGYGHVFVGGPAPALAYQIAPDEVRVMFDIPDNAHGLEALEKDPAYLETLPEPFRSDVRRAMATEQPLVSANFSVTPDAVIKGRLAFVGDSGGCCHPLTATGISVCTADAMRLRRALRETKGDIGPALRRYAALREGPTRTRGALAEALYEAFTARTPEMHLVREGLLRYWKRSRSGRAASMALLSTYEGRMSVMARQYASVVGHALPELLKWTKTASYGELGSRRAALLGLARATIHYAGEALKGYVDGVYVPHTPAEARQTIRLQVAKLRRVA